MQYNNNNNSSAALRQILCCCCLSRLRSSYGWTCNIFSTSSHTRLTRTTHSRTHTHVRCQQAMPNCRSRRRCHRSHSRSRSRSQSRSPTRRRQQQQAGSAGSGSSSSTERSEKTNYAGVLSTFPAIRRAAGVVVQVRLICDFCETFSDLFWFCLSTLSLSLSFARTTTIIKCNYSKT